MVPGEPFDEGAACTCCVWGTLAVDLDEHIYHASEHYYGGSANANHPLRCDTVPRAFLGTSERKMETHRRGHTKFNLLTID